MLETMLTLVFLVTGSDGILLRLESPAVGLAAAGDRAVVYRIDRDPAGEATADGVWRPEARGQVVDTGQGLAVVVTPPLDGGDTSALRVAIEVPAARLASDGTAPGGTAPGDTAPGDTGIADPDALLDRAGTVLRGLDDERLAEAVARAIPADERVELNVLALLQNRWAAREAAIDPANVAGTETDPAVDGDAATSGVAAPESESAGTPVTAGKPVAAGAGTTAATDAAATTNPGDAWLDESGVVPVHVEMSSADGESSVPDDAEAALIDALPEAPPPAIEQIRGADDEPPSIGITARIREWAAARSAGDIDAVLAFYAADFRPDGGLDRATWAARLRADADGSRERRIDLADLDASFYGGTDRARVTFVERITSGGVAGDDRGVRLMLVWERDDWRILEETRDQ